MSLAKAGKTKDKTMRRFQHDFSADYARDAQLPSMKHNISADPQLEDLSGFGINNVMLSKAYEEATPYGDISVQQERIRRAMKGYSAGNQSITGMKASTVLKPAMQVKNSNRLILKESYGSASNFPRRLSPFNKDSKKELDPDSSLLKGTNMHQEQADFGEIICPTTTKPSIFS